jgi:hypothetical protein
LNSFADSDPDGNRTQLGSWIGIQEANILPRKEKKLDLSYFKKLAKGLQASCSSRTSLKGLKKKYKAVFLLKQNIFQVLLKKLSLDPDSDKVCVDPDSVNLNPQRRR